MAMREAMAPTTPPARAGAREWLGLAVIALPCMLYSMDLTVLHLAVPRLSAELRPSSAQLLWIIDIYGFLVAGSLITMGTLGDRIGRRLLLIGAAAFGVASVPAAFSRSPEMYGLTVLVVFGGFLFLPQYLQLVLGLSPLQSGLWTLPWAVAFIVGSNLTPLIVRRVHPASLMFVGLLLAAAGFGAFTQVNATSGFALVVIGSVVFSLGTSPVFTLTTDLIIGAAPPERAGAASAISETGAELGAALGIAVIGSIGGAVYRAALTGALPAAIPVEAATAARDTLGGAVAIAGQLPSDLGTALVRAAQGAFIESLQLTAAISAIGAIAVALLVAGLLRRVQGAPAPGHRQGSGADGVEGGVLTGLGSALGRSEDSGPAAP